MIEKSVSDLCVDYRLTYGLALWRLAAMQFGNVDLALLRRWDIRTKLFVGRLVDLIYSIKVGN